MRRTMSEFEGKSGKHKLVLISSELDPKWTSVPVQRHKKAPDDAGAVVCDDLKSVTGLLQAHYNLVYAPQAAVCVYLSIADEARAKVWQADLVRKSCLLFRSASTSTRLPALVEEAISLIGSRLDPRLSRVALSFLLEAIERSLRPLFSRLPAPPVPPRCCRRRPSNPPRLPSIPPKPDWPAPVWTAGPSTCQHFGYLSRFWYPALRAFPVVQSSTACLGHFLSFVQMSEKTRSNLLVLRRTRRVGIRSVACNRLLAKRRE